LMSINPLRIIVAMSGGVDSSVAAAILKNQGHDVIGVMMGLWSEPGTVGNLCCTPDAMALARGIAAQLDMPFYTVDTKEVFRENVVQFFIDSYLRGETPNPCVACNRRVRWDTLLAKADELGASHIATGHYARLREDDAGRVQLLRGIDAQKDQSYVLHGLPQEKLTRSIFPLGEFTKPEIRELARQYKLPVAERPDSQDLCFVGGGDYRDFLQRHAPEVAHPGPIVTRDGQEIGQHEGLAFYTIGQRKGIGIAAAYPLYVFDKDVTRNTLVVSPVGDLGRDELYTGPVNWISEQPPQNPVRLLVKIRYKAQDVYGRVSPLNDGRAHIQFERPLRDITPGQAAVFYDGDICLGGGIIEG
jgi:tRNA-specific 2-thiouridylase